MALAERAEDFGADVLGAGVRVLTADLVLVAAVDVTLRDAAALEMVLFEVPLDEVALVAGRLAGVFVFNDEAFEDDGFDEDALDEDALDDEVFTGGFDRDVEALGADGLVRDFAVALDAAALADAVLGGMVGTLPG